MASKTELITSVTGQDGSYLAESGVSRFGGFGPDELRHTAHVVLVGLQTDAVSRAKRARPRTWFELRREPINSHRMRESLRACCGSRPT